MHLLFFNRSFYPDIEATGQFLTELCEDLISYGHTVTVVAGYSHHVNNKKTRSLIKKEEYKSIKIIRVYGTQFPKNFLFCRLINLTTYFLSAFVGGFFVENKPDVVIAQTDPPVSGLLGICFGKLYNAKFIYSCKDLYPEIGIVTGRLTNPFLNLLLKEINLLSFKLAHKVICLGDDMKRKIVKKGISEEKIEIVYDWANLENLYPINKNSNPFVKSHNLQNSFTVMYSGNIGLTQGLEKIVDVANYFKSNHSIKFLIVGDGANKTNLQKLVKEKELTNIQFLPYQQRNELKYSLGAADIHLITIEKGLGGVMVPSKIYGILACGKPFIAWIDEDSEISVIAKKYNCGITLSPGDISAMIQTIEGCLSNPQKMLDMGKNGLEAATKYYERRISTSKFNQIIIKETMMTKEKS